MADKKISQLSASATPLAGTEILPVVQSGATVKTSVADLTLGRSVSAASLTLTTGNLTVSNGKGIDFSATPGTGTSELFADYEEGNWTPTYVPGVGAFAAITYNALTYGRYTKIGNTVTVLGLVVTDSFAIGTAAGLLTINGLPFAPSTNASAAINFSTGWAANNPSGAFTSGNSIYLTYRTTANGDSLSIIASDLATGSFKNYVIFQATYIV